ncbi:sigma-70 family RNA polymerase sigma factor [Prescottella equi]|uniref:sigma-70 family RNA polymerase sigma factor n=1 Tax=Rhodococcus hoagii TaxID=43767 RepID=UPI000A232EF7|nr:sigma-70 family RNA polymerase sigma factor [Prescottella equi]ORL16044.1 RNA polymerase subunit sigma-70 [Prescottella equi]
MFSLVEFEAARPQLTATAFRLLGSIHDAEDAVQSTWVKASTADSVGLRNPAAWLTTVLTRVCLDQLRLVHRHREEPLLADLLPAESVEADEHYLRRENISRALMVVLSVLTPTQRVAYVLHDLFDIPFREVAEALGTTADNAKKQASRARRRIEQRGSSPAATVFDSAVVDAFIAASAGGDISRMLALMTDDCVRVADTALIPLGTPTVIDGARAIAEETTMFAARIRASTPMLVNGRPAYVIAPGGHILAVVDVTTRDSQVARIDIMRFSTKSKLAIPVDNVSTRNNQRS